MMHVKPMGALRSVSEYSSTEATAWNPTSGVGRSAPYSRTEKVRSVRCSRASLDVGTIMGLRQDEEYSDTLLEERLRLEVCGFRGTAPDPLQL